MKTNVLRAAVLLAILSPGISFSSDDGSTSCERYKTDAAYKDMKYARESSVGETENEETGDVVTKYLNVSSDDLRDNADVSDEDWEQHRDTVITD